MRPAARRSASDAARLRCAVSATAICDQPYSAVGRPSYASNVITCPSCGRENPSDSRFCNSCGAPLTEDAPGREYRKVVTVLFCDLAGSTALGESVDPEALRTILARYFDETTVLTSRSKRVAVIVGMDFYERALAALGEERELVVND